MKNSRTHSVNSENKKILEIFATKGDNPGEINLQWDSVGGATGYVVQISKPNAKQNWKHYDIISESSCSITGLKPKQNYLFRVAAINRKEQYPWSNEVEKRI